jgi:TatD DNase family protein
MQGEWAEIPLLTGRRVRFVDSHLHLCQYSEPSSTLALAKVTETLLLSAGVDRETSTRTVESSQAHPGAVKAFVGVHPSQAGKETDLAWLESALRGASGVGEIGLDPRYSPVAPRSPQMKAYKAQLEAAEEAGKPVQVHSRGAEKQCLETLSRFRLGPVLMHWFQAEELLKEVEDRGFFVSFGPALLYSKKLQRMASSLSRTQALSESDGPTPFRPLGGAEGPSLIPSVVFKLAELWHVRFEEARDSVLRNGLTYLGNSGKG